jgi:hypothetical protein
MKTKNAAFAEKLETRQLSAEQVVELTQHVSQVVFSDVLPKLRSTEVRIRNEAVETVAIASGNSLASAFMLVQEYGVPEREETAEILDTIETQSMHIAQTQDMQRIHEHSAPRETDTPHDVVRKSVMLGSQRPTDVKKATLCIDSYVEILNASNKLIAMIAGENPDFESTRFFDDKYGEIIDRIDSLTE